MKWKGDEIISLLNRHTGKLIHRSVIESEYAQNSGCIHMSV